MRLTRPSLARRPAAMPTSAASVITLAATLGCGPAVSLDDPHPAGSSGPDTGAGSFGVPTTFADDGLTEGSGDGAQLDVGSIKLDVAPDIPLPPGSCPPDCQFELGLAWVYEGFPGPAAPEPEDHVAVIVEAGGAITLAEQRQGQLELVRLSEHGQEQWTLPLSLPCDPCRLVDLSLHPSGDLLLAGWGFDAMGTGTPVALAARVELGGPQIAWATGTPLAGGDGIAPRAGPLVVHDASLLFQPVIEASTTEGVEQLELFAYDGTGGGLLYAVQVTTGLASGTAPPPLATYDAFDTLVATHPAWTGAELLSGTVSWVSKGSGVLETTSRVEPSLHLAAAPDGRVLTLGQTAGARQRLLYLDSGEQREPDQWQVIYVLPTVDGSTPVLVVDGYGHAHVVTRTETPAEGVALEVLRWSDEGELVWNVSLPLGLDRVDQPISLALGPSGNLVLGGFVGGARHVEQRVPGCICG